MRGAAFTAAAAVILAGCAAQPASPSGPGNAPTRTTPTIATPAPTPGVPVGPGPQRTYSAQPQPPAGTCHYGHAGAYPLPDPVCTPGALSPAVTQATLKTTICVRGYTTTIRPPKAVTGREKRANAKAYGYTGPFTTAEMDHLIPLELGGDPNDARNLWVEPNDIPAATKVINTKDGVESSARAAVCSGRMPLAQAQSAIATDWVQLGRTLGAIK